MIQIRKFPARQKGAGYYALIVVLTLLGIMIFAALKVAPLYVNDQIVRAAIENMKDSGELKKMSIRDLRQHVARTMQANGESFDTDKINQVEDGNVDYIEVEYESRKPVFFNLDAVAKFKYRIEK